MDEQVADLPEAYVELVRDALLHLYDPSHLQTHALLAAMGDDGSASATRGKRLYQALLGAIEALRPSSGTEAQSRAWRGYRILELRYIDGREAASVMSQVALSKNQYHRDHGRALSAVASLLWERWHLAGRWPGSAEARGVPEPGPHSGSQELARLEAEQLLTSVGPGHADRIDLADVLASVAILLRPLCAKRGVSLQTRVPPQFPSVVVSRVALRQALLTALAQVIGVAAPEEVEVGVACQAERIAIRACAKLDPAQGSVRLSLEQSLPFVETIQGSLHVSTSESTSAGRVERVIVDLSFPIRQPQRSNLLVVDNNLDFIRLVERYLEGHGWEVIGASDVDRASALVEQIRPRAILLDLVIPGRDGWELLLALKSAPQTHEIPVIVCSVLREPEVALSIGASAFLQKPIDQKQLLTALDLLPTLPETP